MCPNKLFPNGANSQFSNRKKVGVLKENKA